MTGETARAQAALEKRIIKRKERDEEAQNVAYVAADPGNMHASREKATCDQVCYDLLWLKHQKTLQLKETASMKQRLLAELAGIDAEIHPPIQKYKKLVGQEDQAATQLQHSKPQKLKAPNLKNSNHTSSKRGYMELEWNFEMVNLGL